MPQLLIDQLIVAWPAVHSAAERAAQLNKILADTIEEMCSWGVLQIARDQKVKWKSRVQDITRERHSLSSQPKR